MSNTNPSSKARLATGVALAALALGAEGRAATDCGGLAGKTFGAATITSATTIVPPSSLVNRDPSTPVAVKAPFCRVQGTIKPSADSDIGFEVWLPPGGTWNGKYQGIGNGGFAGSMSYPAMASALEGGYAVSATDAGHSGGALDASWALGHPEKIVDFGWRAIHETALASKAIVEAYYAKPARHAYFSGCSDGGREALLEAQRFPSDYDGIVAGAPAHAWTRLMTNAIGIQQALARPGGWISPEKLATVTKAALAACDGDAGYVEDPSKCHFDPATLLCEADPSNACLTEPELASLRAIYAGASDANGKAIFPGFPAGGEAGPAAWPLWITGVDPGRYETSQGYLFGTGFYANFVFGTTNWEFRTLNLSDALAAAAAKTGPALDATATDLEAFRAAGGKLLQYHGWSDPAIPAFSSIGYYEAVAAKFGGIDNIQPFYRLFLAPGMRHCGGGVAPNAVGGAFGAPPPSRDPAHDVVSALAHWVEDGVAPSEIIATSYEDGDPSRGVAAQRPWCAYPATARYTGQGSRAEAASYGCSTR